MPRKTNPISGDAAQVAGLLAWARANNVTMTSVTVGTCHIELAPQAPVAAPAVPRRQPQSGQARQSIYEQFGGAAFEHIVPPDDEAGELRPALRAKG